MALSLDHEIVDILFSTHYELTHFQRKLSDTNDKMTDQLMMDIVQNLERRERALKSRLLKIMTQNNQYRMPEDKKAAILSLIDFLSADGMTKARLELVTTYQDTFWSVLRGIHDALLKPEEIKLEPPRIKPRVDIDPPEEETYDVQNF